MARKLETSAARPAATLLLPILFALVVWIPFRTFTVDDAFITYRHAMNFGHGLGPVMNPGERVEGVSSLPWTLVLGALSAVGLAPHRSAPILSLLCGLATVPLAARLAARGTTNRRAPMLAAWIAAAGVPVAIWGASGMESTPYVVVMLLFATAAASAAERGTGWTRAGLLGGALAALRPEALLLAGIGAVAALWRVPDRRRALVRFALAAAAVVIPILLFRIFYYGDWLPNPARAKSPNGLAGLGPGMLYVAKMLLSFPIAALALVALLDRTRTRPAARVTLALVAAQVGFVLTAGGDHFQGYRFGVPLWPLAACALAWQMTAAPSRFRQPIWIAAAVLGLGGLFLMLRPEAALPLSMELARFQRLQKPAATHAGQYVLELRHAGVCLMALCAWLIAESRLRAGTPTGGGFALRVAVLLAATLLPVTFDPTVRICRQPDAATRYGRPVGEWLGTALPAGSLVATNAAGNIPYWSRLPVLDMLGLNDRYLARTKPDTKRWVGHEHGDGAYVLGKRPAIVIFGGPEGSLTPWPFRGDQELAALPGFREQYVPQQVPVADFQFTFWARRDLVGTAAPATGPGL